MRRRSSQASTRPELQRKSRRQKIGLMPGDSSKKRTSGLPERKVGNKGSGKVWKRDVNWRERGAPYIGMIIQRSRTPTKKRTSARRSIQLPLVRRLLGVNHQLLRGKTVFFIIVCGFHCDRPRPAIVAFLMSQLTRLRPHSLPSPRQCQ